MLGTRKGNQQATLPHRERPESGESSETMSSAAEMPKI